MKRKRCSCIEQHLKEDDDDDDVDDDDDDDNDGGGSGGGDDVGDYLRKIDKPTSSCLLYIPSLLCLQLTSAHSYTKSKKKSETSKVLRRENGDDDGDGDV